MIDVKCFLLFAFVASVKTLSVVDNVLNKEWALFKLQYAKFYSNPFEEAVRKRIYLQNKLEIAQHNQLYELGQVSYQQGLNEYSDLDQNEFLALMNGGRNSSVTNIDDFMTEGVTFIPPDLDVLLPSSVDWRKKGAVTRVKSQERCGSCWAFSTTGSLEGQYYRKTGKLVEMSEQNLVDCSDKNKGCQGGTMIWAYEYIKKNGGIDTEASYPYEAHRSICRYKRKNSVTSIASFTKLKKGSEMELKQAVATVGPIAVVIDSTLQSFRNYRQGVYFDSKCDPVRQTHAVLVVGYGTTNKGEDFWIVKNSWNKNWGNKGYVYMARNRNNLCGIASHASYPLV